MGIDGPTLGFSCWSFDYDNDGWLDIFATATTAPGRRRVAASSASRTRSETGRLYRNLGGKRFEDVTREAGLDWCYAPWAPTSATSTTTAASTSTWAPASRPGTLDAQPHVQATWPANTSRTSPICSRTGHLQKGHAVACGDWDRDGNVDLFIEMGGATPGDRYHNVLFQNPGQGNHSLTSSSSARRRTGRPSAPASRR